jgi:N-acetylglucosaminyl-diphospho-decaprenol L-rhamnosyltransferase
LTTAAVVIWTPGDPDPGDCLESLAPQVDELVLVANPGGSPSAPGKTLVLENERTLGFGANINRGIAATTAPFVAASNPDIEATPGSIAALHKLAAAHPRCGIAGPQMRYPDDRWQPSRRSFPTVSGTIVRRTPLRSVLHPERRQRRHYLLDERPTEPVPSDWLLGAFLFLRREMLTELGGLDEGYRLYGDDIDLAYRARKAGWERWYVPGAVVVHHHQAVTDHRFFTRRTLWHWRSMLRFVRKHPESLRELV